MSESGQPYGEHQSDQPTRDPAQMRAPQSRIYTRLAATAAAAFGAGYVLATKIPALDRLIADLYENNILNWPGTVGLVGAGSIATILGVHLSQYKQQATSTIRRHARRAVKYLFVAALYAGAGAATHGLNNLNGPTDQLSADTKQVDQSNAHPSLDETVKAAHSTISR